MPKIEAPAEVTLPLPDPKAVEKKPEKNPDKSETTPVEDNTPVPEQQPSPGSIASRASSKRRSDPGPTCRPADGVTACHAS